MSRRQFVQISEAFAAAGMALPSLSVLPESLETLRMDLPSTRYNLVIIMTDEERFPQ